MSGGCRGRVRIICRYGGRCRIVDRLVHNQVADQAGCAVLHGPAVALIVGCLNPWHVVRREGLGQLLRIPVDTIEVGGKLLVGLAIALLSGDQVIE